MKSQTILHLDSIEIRNGDQLRNVNSYEYLRHIVTNIPNHIASIDDGEKLTSIRDQIMQEYNPLIPYGDLYTEFLFTLEKVVQNNLDLPPDYLYPIVNAVYNNPNHALQRAF